MEFDQTIADEICDRLTEGESLRAICADEHIPSFGVITRWLASNPNFNEQYARSREAYADSEFEKIQEIADDSENDWIERKHFAGADSSPQLNGEAVARARLRIDTIKWRLGKLRPKKYGDKLEVDQTINAADPLMALLTQAATGKRLGDVSDD